MFSWIFLVWVVLCFGFEVLVLVLDGVVDYAV